MSALTFEELKRIALHATPGPWLPGMWFGFCAKLHEHRGERLGVDPCVHDYKFGGSNRIISAGTPEAPVTIIGNEEDRGLTISPADQAFIAAFNPAVALQMIGEIQRLERQVAALNMKVENSNA